MFKISTDGKDWKEVTCYPNESFEAGEQRTMVMTYLGVKHVMLGDNGETFTFDADHCDMEVGKKYEIKLP